jgi:hypothetical protein
LRAVFLYGPDFITMRILYTILFFTDTILLICLSYLFLQLADNGGKLGALILIFSGMLVSICLLILLLRIYIKQPPGKRP